MAGHWVSTAWAHRVATTGQRVTRTGHWVAVAGHVVLMAGHCVQLAGHMVTHPPLGVDAQTPGPQVQQTARAATAAWHHLVRLVLCSLMV